MASNLTYKLKLSQSATIPTTGSLFRYTFVFPATCICKRPKFISGMQICSLVYAWLNILFSSLATHLNTRRCFSKDKNTVLLNWMVHDQLHVLIAILYCKKSLEFQWDWSNSTNTQCVFTVKNPTTLGFSMLPTWAIWAHQFEKCLFMEGVTLQTFLILMELRAIFAHFLIWNGKLIAVKLLRIGMSTENASYLWSKENYDVQWWSVTNVLDCHRLSNSTGKIMCN